MDMIAALGKLAPIGAIVLFAAGVYQYYRSNELAFRKPYWEQLLALYTRATTTAATLATSHDEVAWNKAQEEFWLLYYGPLCLVENPEVETAMVEFSDLLREATLKGPERTKLKTAALSLAYACRESIRHDWSIPLETLEGQRS